MPKVSTRYVLPRLADELGVTRGSFYWHFGNREDLINALVAYWKDHNTKAVVDSVKDADSLSNGIFAFFETCLDAELFDPRLDLAIREWARRSTEVREHVDSADNTRVQALTEFFQRFDYPMPEAFIRARVLYFAQIGFYALDVREPLETRISYSEAYFPQFLRVKTLDPVEAERFRQMTREKYGDLLP